MIINRKILYTTLRYILQATLIYLILRYTPYVNMGVLGAIIMTIILMILFVFLEYIYTNVLNNPNDCACAPPKQELQQGCRIVCDGKLPPEQENLKPPVPVTIKPVLPIAIEQPNPETAPEMMPEIAPEQKMTEGFSAGNERGSSQQNNTMRQQSNTQNNTMRQQSNTQNNTM